MTKFGVTKMRGRSQTGRPKFKLFNHSRSTHEIFRILVSKYVGYWVAMLNSVLRLEMAVKCVHISGRG